MAFIGNQPALSYTSFAVQHFTTSATTSYTLNYPVANENEIRLVINNVVQQPGSSYAYTASGTSLTLSAATTVSDTMYAVFLGKAVQTVNPPNGSVGLSQLSATGTKDSTTFLRGDNTFVNVYNTPSFFVYPTTGQTATHNTTNKITFGSESYDTDSAFASSRFTVPSGKAGKYYIHASVYTEAAANGTLETSNIYIYINGSAKFANTNDFRTNQIRGFTTTVSGSFNLAVGDYVEIYHYYYSSALANGTYGSGDTGGTYFGGYKITE
jgi:hypothetical protein